ncbi:hypothetical protein [Kitasatospora sp. CB01950]|uniref:hypothetical protein n=1 Tax=Kitasatospora sp. CB01950 TaxID=1703930 RepID=UPI00093B17BE|nr:hypothetical protein [Kitasatospora sp. CB01950]OKI95100.1 hypothetical protein AMK19_33060 [Kitasatospora sp. CB01950]
MSTSSNAGRSGLGRRLDDLIATTDEAGRGPASPRATAAERIVGRQEDLTPEQQVLLGRARRQARATTEAAQRLLAAAPGPQPVPRDRTPAAARPRSRIDGYQS